MEKHFKLHELPLDTKKRIKIYCEVSDGSEYIFLKKIDGLYGYCTTQKGEVTHLHILTKLQKHRDGYVLYRHDDIIQSYDNNPRQRRR